MRGKLLPTWVARILLHTYYYFSNACEKGIKTSIVNKITLGTRLARKVTSQNHVGT